MISFKNKGRTGNFLFQAAAAMGYAYKWGIPFSVPTHTNNLIWNPIYFAHLINPWFDEDLPKMIIEEKQHSYHELPKPRLDKCNIYLDGYWQSYKYFEHVRPEILHAFQLGYWPESKIVALHVRRGDYLLYPHINPLATRAYYEQAINFFNAKGYVTFKVFSDDMPWCVQEFQDPVYKGNQFYFQNSGDVLYDLSLMSSCEHAIISNSTYSWWGAWLNQNPDKAVVCPHEDNYYGPANKHLDVNTLYPTEWIRIKY